MSDKDRASIEIWLLCRLLLRLYLAVRHGSLSALTRFAEFANIR